MRNVLPQIQLEAQRGGGRGIAPAPQPAAAFPRGKGPAPSRHPQGRRGKASAAWQYRRH